MPEDVWNLIIRRPSERREDEDVGTGVVCALSILAVWWHNDNTGSILPYTGVTCANISEPCFTERLQLRVIVDSGAGEEDEHCDALSRLVDVVYPAYVVRITRLGRIRAGDLRWKEHGLLPCLSEIPSLNGRWLQHIE